MTNSLTPRDARLRLLAGLSIPLFFFAIIGLWFANLRSSYQSPSVLLVLSFVCSFLVSLFVAYLIGRRFLVQRTVGLLLLGCGVLACGTASLVGAIAGIEGGNGGRIDINILATTHNLSLWLSALFHMAGVIFARNSTSPLRKAGLWLTTAYTLVLGAVGLIALAALSHWTPLFFVQGQGGTNVRLVVLGAAIGMFLLAAILLGTLNYKALSPFVYWYALALVLLALGLFGFMLQTVHASVLGWTSCAAQFLAGIYMFIAAITLRGSGTEELPLELELGRRRYPYAVAIVTVLAATAVRLAFLPMLGTTAPFLTFYPAVMLAALYGGTRAGLLAAALAVWLVHFFWMEPVGNILIHGTSNWLIAALFLLCGGFISWVADTMQHAQARALRAEVEVQLALERQRTAEALQESEQKHRFFFENSMDAIFLTSPDGKVQSANSAACMMFGMSEEEICCIGRQGMVDPADTRLDAFLAARARSETINCELNCIRKDGTRFPTEISSVILGDGSHSFVIVRDLTERKKAEAALRKSQEQLRLMVEQAPITVAMFDRDMYYIATSKRWIAEYGRGRHDLTGLCHYDIKYDMPDYWKEVHQKALEGEVQECEDDKWVQDDGTVIWLRWAVYPWFDVKQQIGGIIIFTENITTRKVAEELLKESEMRYRSLFENNRDATFTVNSEGRFLTANPAAEALSGYSCAELQQTTFAKLCVPELLEKTMQSFLANFHDEHPWVETAMLSKDGSRVELFITGTLVHLGEEGDTLFCIARNITKSKRKELARSLTIELLELVNASNNTRSLIQTALTFFQQHSGCDSVGIRLCEGDDFPYYESRGFPQEFIQKENSLCGREPSGCIQRDEKGGVILECICGCLLASRSGLKKHLTACGSFWTPDVPAAAQTLSGEGISNLRGRCMTYGYQSMALIPLGRKGKRIGLLQLNSFKKGHFTADDIFFWERLAEKLSISIAEFQANEALLEAQAKLKAHAKNLEKTVAERTSRLWEQTAEREKLQEELLKISEREKQLIAQELHDGLCQHLAGTALMGSLLHRRLAARQDPEADHAKEISDLLCTGVQEARNLSHGLHPVSPKGDGLMEALEGLAQTVTKLFHIQCTFSCDDSVFLEDQTTATHLFRIAQEAMNNAMKHGQATKVYITLKNSEEGVSLSIRDNGIGIPSELPPSRGMGMQIMNHRAEVIGAWLVIRRAGKRGTVVTCTLPLRVHQPSAN